MKFIKNILDKKKPLFKDKGKFSNFYYLFEALESFLFTPPTTTAGGVHIRDAVDLKRSMLTVVIAMLPCLLFGMWNVGHQHFISTGVNADFWDKFLLGGSLVLPIILVSYTSGGLVEMVFSIVRKHPLNEGFLVTGMLIPLIMPINIPLWQVGLASIFSVLIVKEVFGGTGMNILNVAMTARAFLYFAYPGDMSGEIWVFSGDNSFVEGYSGATPLSIAASVSATGGSSIVETLNGFGNSWQEGLFSFESLFLGMIPGSIGETSFLFVLLGGLILIVTGVGSWKIILSVFSGAYLFGLLLNMISVNEYMSIPAHYHLVMGGFAFGAIFMATDPVTAPHTERGKWIYGILIGVFTVIIRVFNPAYPEGIMLAILLMNVFSALIDFYILQGNKKHRLVKQS